MEEYKLFIMLVGMLSVFMPYDKAALVAMVIVEGFGCLIHICAIKVY